jgi:hypothetical protein
MTEKPGQRSTKADLIAIENSAQLGLYPEAVGSKGKSVRQSSLQQYSPAPKTNVQKFVAES